MKKALAALVVGFIFALGLGISGMTQVTKVFGFLDVFGQWDPSLIFVMAGAILVHAVGYHFVRRMNSPVLDTEFHVPKKRGISASLVSGAFIFGVGWGLAGFCPGPALVSLVTLDERPWMFVVCMLIGMRLFTLLSRTRIYSPP
ncbi:MAG: YeeE/YedE family protein [Proteobacteria bacterium]|nr:MAG: YeeE/YedE family protein [Pseudomonadota bacterium]